MNNFGQGLRRRLQLTTALTLGFAGVALGANLPSDWEKKSSPPDAEIYSVKKGEATETITFLERKKPTLAEAPRSSEELKKKTIADVNRQTKILGIEDWTVTSAQLFPIPHGKLFKLRGNYLGSDHQKVYFEEWKIYLKNGFAQITFSEKGKTQASMPDSIEPLLKSFKPFGENL